MKKLFIIANWKSYKTQVEAVDWLEKSLEFRIQNSELKEKEVIVCPSFTLLSEVSFFIQENKLSLKVGAQDISPFGEGAYTGAVHAKQVKEFSDYTIIGHSERRRFFHETDEILAKKVMLAKEAGLISVYCVQSKEELVPEDVEIVAYEPVTAIGTGNPDTPENAQAVAEAIRSQFPHVHYVLYGGSVKPENVLSFTSLPAIHGVLVGGASLSPDTFFQLAHNA